jgi:hypothetical protein
MLLTGSTLDWFRHHRWRVLLGALGGLLAVSPISDVYNRADNLISPLVALVVLAVMLCTGLGKIGRTGMALLTIAWLIVAVATDGSGLFAGASIVAPVMFLVIVGLVFVLLARWLAHLAVINAEVLAAAVCGYLMLAFFGPGCMPSCRRWMPGPSFRRRRRPAWSTGT